MATNFPRVEQGLKFARDVVRGKRPACRYVQLACKRHLDDLAASRKKDFRWKFDPEAAERKLALIELLPHTKGEWAFKKQLVTLEPWQKFGLMATFGWLNKRTGKRRFRESYWEVPRKNGKSVIAAGVGIGMFVLDDEFGAEVYAGATTEKQAWEVFRPARLMVKRSPELIVAADIEVNASNMNKPEDGSRFEPLIGNPGDGASPSCSIVDEYHEPEDTVRNTENRRMAERYQAWVNLGFLFETDGAEIDYRDILDEAKEANRLCPVQCTPLDPHGATNLSHQLADEGLTPVTIVQNYTNMSDPMKELEAAITSGRFHHDGNPIMTWCVSNVIGKNLPGNDDVVRPIKQGNDNKIDGAVALIMAVGRAMLADRVDSESIYDQGVGV